MLSRASLHSIQKPISFLLARAASKKPSVASCIPCNSATPRAPDNNNLYIRPVRPELSGAVRHGFIPEEWFTYFYKKTGVTGPYAFAFTLFTYLASKEIYVMEHEYYTGLGILVYAGILVKYIGPDLKKYLDDECDAIAKSWNAGRDGDIQSLEEGIENEKKEQWRAEGQVMLNDAKMENVALQLEAAYRARLASAYAEVKRRLDYQVEVQLVERRVKQRHLVNWVHAKVIGSITPDQDNETLNRCIADLGALTKA